MATHLDTFGNSAVLRFVFTYAEHELCHWATLPATHGQILSQDKELMDWGVWLSCQCVYLACTMP